jgi:hypothetical protein
MRLRRFRSASSHSPPVEIPHRQRALSPRCRMLANLPAVENDLDQGNVVVFEPHRIRIRRLPFSP